MFDWIRTQVLRFMRVPHDPTPPLGAAGSIRVFRAGSNYYNLRLVRWGLGQAGALVGLCFSLGFFWWFKSDIEMARLARDQPAAVSPAPLVAVTPAQGQPTKPAGKSRRNSRNDLRRLAAHTPGWVIPLIGLFEVGGILLFLVQIPVTFAAVRLEFEQHWYIVTDRSLRIRTGLLRLQESTMSFANLQQVEVQQGPLQRLLGLADVHVQSAGGGGDHSDRQQGDSLHTGIFHSVENATEIRDLILARLRQFRQTGLGDPDEHHDQAHAAEVTLTSTNPSETLAAAHEILVEARALRAALLNP